MITRATIKVTGSAGGAGTSTANATSAEIIRGIIKAVHLAYVGSPPGATTDVTVAGVTTPAVAILTVTDAATDAWFYPMGAACNAAGAAITNQGAEIVIDDQVKVTIAQANDADGVTATILYDDGR